MAYATRWDIPFRDIQGTLRHIYIQQDGWSGNVTTLQGGNTPIDWSEDDSDDILKRVRSKTGHIEVIENTYGELVDLFPTTSRSHRVIVPGMFYGYIKPQSSDIPWKSGPRILKFNIQSPLALVNNTPMNVINSAGDMVEITYAFAEMMNIAGYDHIIMPVGTTAYTDAFNGQLYNKIISPYSSGKEYRMTTDADAYAPISIGEFLKQYGDTHDLVAHDAVIGNDAVLMFTRFSNPGNYYHWTREMIEGDVTEGELINSDVLTNLFTENINASDKNSEHIRNPYSGIDVYNSGEDFEDADLPFFRSLFAKDPQYSLRGTLTPRGRWITLTQFSALKSSITWKDGDNYQFEEYLELNVSNTQSSNVNVATIVFDELRDECGYKLIIEFSENRGMSGYLTILADGHYETINIADYIQDKKYEFPYYIEADHIGCIRIELSCQQNLTLTTGVANIKLEKTNRWFDANIENNYAEYNYVTSIEGSIGNERLRIDVPWNQSHLSNMYTTLLSFSGSPYPVYVLQSMIVTKIIVRTSRALTPADYLQKYYIDSTGRRWRIVAISQNPRRCEAKITLISSYILE